jgi:hypothetical protein
MKQTSLKNHPGLFSAISAGLFIVFSGVATEGFAAEVLVNARSSSNNINFGTDTNSSMTGSVSASANTASNPSFSSASFSGNATNSVFAGSASTQGTGTASADYHREFSFTNSSTNAQNYSLSGLITQGGLGIVNSFIPLPSAYSGDAYFRWSISFQGAQIEIMKGSFSLSDSAPAAYTVTGSLPGGLQNVISSNSGFTWEATPFTTLLGTLNAGEIGNVSIDAIVSANSDFGLAPGYSYAAGLRARFGDPSDLSSYSITSEQVSAVPEPAEWLLLTAGLAVVARKAKRAKAKRAAKTDEIGPSTYPADSRTCN